MTRMGVHKNKAQDSRFTFSVAGQGGTKTYVAIPSKSAPYPPDSKFCQWSTRRSVDYKLGVEARFLGR